MALKSGQLRRLKTYRTKPAPLNVLTVAGNPPPVGEIGAQYLADFDFHGGIPPYHPGITGLGGPTIDDSGLVSGALTGSPGTRSPILTVSDSTSPIALTAIYNWSVVVSAAPIGAPVNAQTLTWGDQTPANTGGDAPVANATITSAVINSGNGAGYFGIDAATGFFSLTAAGVAAFFLGASIVLSCSFNGAAAVNITMAKEAVSGRSVKNAAERDAAFAAILLTGNKAIFHRPGQYGNMSPTGKAFTGPVYITKHTGQVVKPTFGRLFPNGVDNLWFTGIDIYNNYALPSRQSGHIQVTSCDDFHLEDCDVHGIYRDPAADYNNSSVLMEQSGTGLVTKALCVGFYVKRCRFYDLWVGLNCATVGPGGIQEYEDNQFGPTFATSMTIGVNMGTQVSTSIKRNVYSTWTTNQGDLPAKSHTDALVLFQGPTQVHWGWHHLEVYQNIFFKGPGAAGCKVIFSQGEAYNTAGNTASLENPKFIDNTILMDGNDQGIWVNNTTGFEVLFAGNIIIDWSLGHGISTYPRLVVGGTGPGLMKLYGNITGQDYPDGTSTTIDGMTVECLHNINTGPHGSIIPYSDLFAGGGVMAPVTRAEVLSMMVQLPACGISGPRGGHSVYPTAALDSAGASMVDEDGSFWSA